MTKILALDISTKTGWSFAKIKNKKYILIDSGTIEKRDKPDLPYPSDYVEWAKLCYEDIIKIIDKYQPDHLVIEETSKGSKNNFSQKILEFIHYLLAVYIDINKISTTYYRTEEWRRICGCKMSKNEKKQNATVRKARKSGVKVVKDKDDKRIGIIGKKHVNVRRANEIFDLQLILKDEDRADALLLGYSYFLNK